ncbi:hypothetical protein GF352_02865 [archaeon]|nr:hypothetical protein [archaeon]
MFVVPGHLGVGLIVSALAGFNSFDALMLVIGSIIPDFDTIPYLFGVDYRKTHRTITHSIFMPLVTALISIPLTIGLVIHLLFDVMFYPGTKLFYPFSQKEFYVIKGRLKKYYDPLLMISDWFKKKRIMAFELLLLFIGIFLSLRTI